MICPTCRKRFESPQSTALPFCSDRCRQIDLGRWLSEEQRLPNKGLDDDSQDEESLADRSSADNDDDDDDA